jgi:hypothetical protein
VIAVSAGMREDILRSYPSIDPAKVKVVHNGIDSQLWQPNHDLDVCPQARRRPGPPSVIFVGRITRQKGLPYLLRAAAELPAGRPGRPVRRRARHPRDHGRGRGTDGRPARQARRRRRLDPGDAAAREVIALLTAATVFACPSVYEPLGIVNLEAMACELPVVATATGGIPEVVVDGETGWLVPIEQVQDGTGTPSTPTSSSPTWPRPQRRGERPRPGPRLRPGRPRAAPSTPSPGPASATAPSRSTGPSSARPREKVRALLGGAPWRRGMRHTSASLRPGGHPRCRVRIRAPRTSAASRW